MRVFLIHGLGRTPLSLAVLGARLRAAGHRPSYFGYWASRQSFAAIVARFAQRIQQVLARDAAASSSPVLYAVIGHSLGNLITRQASSELPRGFSRFVMLAPPNSSPQIARSLRLLPPYSWIAGDAGRKLVDPDFFASLPIPAVPSLIIAGNRGPRWPRLLFWAEPNDLLLSVEETRLPGVPLLEVPAQHTFLMNRRDVFRAICDFLAERGGGSLIPSSLA